MFGALLMVMLHFLFRREPGIDNLPRGNPRKMTWTMTVWEAVTAHSHHPDYPAEIAVESEPKSGDWLTPIHPFMKSLNDKT